MHSKSGFFFLLAFLPLLPTIVPAPLVCPEAPKRKVEETSKKALKIERVKPGAERRWPFAPLLFFRTESQVQLKAYIPHLAGPPGHTMMDKEGDAKDTGSGGRQNQKEKGFIEDIMTCLPAWAGVRRLQVKKGETTTQCALAV